MEVAMDALEIHRSPDPAILWASARHLQRMYVNFSNCSNEGPEPQYIDNFVADSSPHLTTQTTPRSLRHSLRHIHAASCTHLCHLPFRPVLFHYTTWSFYLAVMAIPCTYEIVNMPESKVLRLILIVIVAGCVKPSLSFSFVLT